MVMWGDEWQTRWHVVPDQLLILHIPLPVITRASLCIHMNNNYIVRSYTFVIVVTSSVKRRTIKAKSTVMY